MKEEVLYGGEKKIKSITTEFACDCGREFEVTIKVKSADKTGGSHGK